MGVKQIWSVEAAKLHTFTFERSYFDLRVKIMFCMWFSWCVCRGVCVCSRARVCSVRGHMVDLSSSSHVDKVKALLTGFAFKIFL